MAHHKGHKGKKHYMDGHTGTIMHGNAHPEENGTLMHGDADHHKFNKEQGTPGGCTPPMYYEGHEDDENTSCY
jgi:hypothetical protein